MKSGTYLYRIAQEAVNNVVKHAEAETLELDIRINENNLEFICRDDGKGFDAASVSGGNGILNMKERALLIDGQFIINAKPGIGTEIIVKIPYA
jgi:signal transduction histidine kinase